jgi:predicted MFS family arabinose efflux permease
LSDRFGKYRVICGATLASMVGALGTALSSDFGWLLVFRTLHGATAAAAVPMSMAWIADNVPYERRQPVLAYFLVGQIFGIISGQLFGGLFADLTGWRGAFWFMLFAFGAVGGLLLMEIKRSPDIDAAAASTTSANVSFLRRFGAVFAVPWARIILFGACIEGACVFGGLAFVPTYLHVRFGISLTHAGALMTSFGFGGLAYALQARRFVGRLGERGLAIGGGCLGGIAYLIFIFAPSWWFAIPGAFCAGMGYYMMHNTFQINATQMVPAHRGTAVALFAGLFFLGQSSGVALNAFITDNYGFVEAFLIAVLTLPLIGFVFATLIGRKMRKAAG